MGGRPDIEVVDDVAGAAAQRIATAVCAGGHIALSGGSTPRAAYELVAAQGGLDWSQTTLWFGDERVVAGDHKHSHSAMVRASLLDRIEGPAPAVHRVQGELTADQAAERYEAELREAFGSQRPPRMDLLLLGLGSDAHCASLFPGDAALAERERLVVGVQTPGMPPPVPRVTFTLPVLDAAHGVVFLISGDDKAEAAARAFRGARDTDAPASLVSPEPGRLTVLIDPGAAARLGARP
ncbi:MAG: 6-phosphogluconolactonase [Thermoleophilaceae bacterium]